MVAFFFFFLVRRPNLQYFGTGNCLCVCVSGVRACVCVCVLFFIHLSSYFFSSTSFFPDVSLIYPLLCRCHL